MAYKITNNAPGRRGVWARGRLAWIEPGQTSKPLDLDDPASAKRSRDLTFEPVGDLPDVPAKLLAAVSNKPAPAKAAPRRRTTRKR